MDFVWLIIGFVLLIKGADFFVDGASNIARLLKVPTLIIGLTIVAFGTSAPELAVSLSAAIKGSNEIALGNVIGSNICNLLLIAGTAALIKPLAVNNKIIKRDYPISLGAAVLLYVLVLWQSGVTRVAGIILLVAFAVFMYVLIKDALKSKNQISEEQVLPEKEEKPPSALKSIILTVVGLAGVVFGGDKVVDSASAIGKMLGMSETLIGLTIVAVGTSLPELVTSIVASRKGESDIALGNVVGSNIFNILLILSVSATVSPIVPKDTMYIYDMAILIGVSAFVFVPMAINRKIGRILGAIMVLMYAAYLAYIIVR